jgi:pSer/pThr/pTyr-binding forkhead associated (FHA) protein
VAPKLLLKFNSAIIKDIPVIKTSMTIGRKPDNDIVIDNMAVSGHHAKISLQGNNYTVEDLQSTNGTFLNDKKILNAALRHNDAIIIGQHSLVFMNPEVQPKPDAPKLEIPKAVDSDATMIITPPKTPPGQAPIQSQPEKSELVGMLRVIEGKSEQSEYRLTALLTYIGKGETAAIKIKGFFAPDIAALVSKRQSGYLLTAVKDGYPKLNNNSVSGQVQLKEDDIIEAGGIKFLFQMKEPKAKAPEENK